jgi:hypothetical protein
MRTLLSAALLAALASSANAQRTTAAPTHFAPARQTTPSTSRMRSATARSDFAPLRNLHHANPYRSLFSPLGIFSDSSYPDNPPPESVSPAAQPELLLQALSALNAPQQPPKPDSHSLLIELQGNRYVSLTNAEPSANSPEPTIIPSSLKRPLKRTPKNDPGEKPVATRELMPVTLLFRDGHREDVRDYAIANGVIYVRGDYYNDGYWNKKIELSALDLRETVKSNEARGVRFVLPNTPNEVITRP